VADLSPELLFWTVTACFVYLVVVFVLYLVMLGAALLQNAYVARQSRTEDYQLLSVSRFTIPVSVIAPAYNEASVIEPTVRSLLELNYPEVEIIVVNDGSTDDTLGVLRRSFDLEPHETFYRRQFETEMVRGIYRSRTHPNLVVVDKENGGKADALNAGVNLAGYRYICTVDADTVYYPDALVRSMRFPMQDPATVVGVTSNLTISHHPEAHDRCVTGTTTVDRRWLTNFQMLDYVRAFLNNRMGWTRWSFMLCCSGAFSIWRRDVVIEMGGFSRSFTCEDIEFTFRVHERMRRERRKYRIVALPDRVGRTEGPDTIASLVSQRARWQRVITETVWHYRRMLFNPRYGSVGLVGVPLYLIVEVLAPVFQVISVFTIPLAWWLGVLDWRLFVVLTGTIASANGFLTNMALASGNSDRHPYAIPDLIQLMLLGFVDLYVYRPILVYAQAKGVIDFMWGQKGWHKFERNTRGLDATPQKPARAA
jgi:poly-beta-1,6-N-acetyl-D-glucosamine synthase